MLTNIFKISDATNFWNWFPSRVIDEDEKKTAALIQAVFQTLQHVDFPKAFLHGDFEAFK